ncbi:HDIG domain-containing protein [Ruminiclostridium herbifermentans]|uniref:HDIG domain-containing protein n=1 Tax=Ruminiclostridium herbifermentans TaxID=2488810 RepID=A0A4U7JCL7_9FIRM|nr:HDIG domain-containing metalloprotein [Ruminiclostridium herbifermentans]QNU65666.1 HDIG domain-containing protein [Ruminiclostridium herbifermentans]
MKKAKKGENKISKITNNFAVQRSFMVIITILIAFIIIETGAQPTKYKLNLGDVSYDDITAPRDVINEVLTEENRISARDNVENVTKEDSKAFVQVIYKQDDFFKAISNARTSVDKRMKELGLSQYSKSYNEYLKEARKTAANSLSDRLNDMSISLSQAQIEYLISTVTDSELEAFETLTKQLISRSMSEVITESNIDIHIQNLFNSYKNEQGINDQLKSIGEQLSKSILRTNQIVDEEATEKKRQEAYNDEANIVKIKKGSRIISFGDIVTMDKLKLLEELNLLETKSRYDYLFSLGILAILLFLVGIVAIFLRKYNKKIYKSRKELLLLCLISVIILLIARYLFPYYHGLLIPVFVGTMLTSILLNFELAVVINCILTVCISLLLRGDYKFLYMGLVCGVISAFMVTKAHQRSRLSMNGLLLGLINAVFIVFINFIEKSDATTILTESLAVFINGIVSMVLTIGLLPFLESAFGIVTPLKLLELSNPNHPLLKKLLMEAPGTYHHSLMVGNLAEVAAEDLGANALLARAGAYFHDVGKLKRPDLFTENQLSENPHERMTPNVSSVVITSHTSDGVEIATKYKLPSVIKDIIKQHHGTTLVAYFYYKAIKSESGNEVKQEDYRYEGPNPQTREAAIVMLSDSVEAAVRSMSNKTEEKIEALIRKIIKDKLDDGQLNKCQLTLADLDTIANSFIKVLSGYFHAREQYPDVKNLVKKDIFIEEKGEYNIEHIKNEVSDEARKDGGKKVDNN